MLHSTSYTVSITNATANAHCCTYLATAHPCSDAHKHPISTAHFCPAALSSSCASASSTNKLSRASACYQCCTWSTVQNNHRLDSSVAIPRCLQYCPEGAAPFLNFLPYKLILCMAIEITCLGRSGKYLLRFAISHLMTLHVKCCLAIFVHERSSSMQNTGYTNSLAAANVSITIFCSNQLSFHRSYFRGEQLPELSH